MVVLLLTIGGIVLHSVMSQQPSQPETVTVPDLSGMMESEARTAITNLKLNPVVNSQQGPAETKGQVVSQQPDKGSAVALGTTVTVWINQGPQMGVIPDIKGKTESEARQMLAQEGFVNIPPAVTATPGDIDEPVNYQPGWVLAVSPAVGSTCPYDSPVTLTLATGKSAVPNLVGMTQGPATDVAKQAGFDVIVDTQTTSDCEAGKVCSQNPDPNTYELRTKKIVITIAKAPVIDTPTYPPYIPPSETATTPDVTDTPTDTQPATGQQGQQGQQGQGGYQPPG